ncbi:hypothetical protein [Pseudoalteromonas luteoviolacea]|uniref:Uncharacterized protein n=1 Tax=Pseudoalteromonas luteoviolacea H33 TaxID=1365251 RepID=A0A161Y1J0_9GAMM|nr:hypothetical protein [Pseudoalteromonas luteoviolacea]KZN49890.1 hypothetical protein N476_17955 [Pseudoalteromonas luteoviolacea H33]KZN74804.1 hypothetical protein N477_21370 [Pseudoalteromonas luteoviolacea H33-S]
MSYLPVTLHFIGKSIEFKTLDELSKFINDEKASFDWLRLNKGVFSNFSKFFLQNCINEVFNWFTPLLNNWTDESTPSDDAIDKINRCLAAVNFPFTHTAERNLIEEKVEVLWFNKPGHNFRWYDYHLTRGVKWPENVEHLVKSLNLKQLA